jgi:uncharacterized protein YcbK (DUF882 family)
MVTTMMKSDDRRRRALNVALAGVAAAWAGPLQAAFGASPARVNPWSRPRELWITRPEAQESIRTVFWADGALQVEGCRAINRIYRDLQAGVERPIALGLLNLNYAMQRAIAHSGSPRPMVLLSGFRTPQTNRRVGGVEPSLHFAGQADDFIYAGLSFQDNLRLARLFQVGGLGVYPDRGSLHKDLGAPRIWVQYGHAPSAPREVGLRAGHTR